MLPKSQPSSGHFISCLCVPVSVNTCLLQTQLSPVHTQLLRMGASSLGHPGVAYLGSAIPALHPLSCVDASPLTSGISQNVHTTQPVEWPHSSASSQKSQGTGGWRVWGPPQRRSSAAIVSEHLSYVVCDTDSQSPVSPQPVVISSRKPSLITTTAPSHRSFLVQ